MHKALSKAYSSIAIVGKYTVILFLNYKNLINQILTSKDIYLKKFFFEVQKICQS